MHLGRHWDCIGQEMDDSVAGQIMLRFLPTRTKTHIFLTGLLLFSAGEIPSYSEESRNTSGKVSKHMVYLMAPLPSDLS